MKKFMLGSLLVFPLLVGCRNSQVTPAAPQPTNQSTPAQQNQKPDQKTDVIKDEGTAPSKPTNTIQPAPSPTHTPTKPVENLPPIETETADLVVQQFYDDVSRQDLDSAWNLVHVSEQQHSRKDLSKDVFTSYFKSLRIQPVESAKVVQTLDEYKFPSVQLTQSPVAIVEVKFKDGSTKTIRLAKNPNRGWKVFWNPQGDLD
jgi:hypothetical protein